jgi:hypothetical protein
MITLQEVTNYFMRRLCPGVLLIFCALQIGIAHSEDAGGGHHRIRVTPDYESVGGTLTSELNVYGGALYNDIFIDYLTHDGWSIGVSTLNMPIQGGHGARGDQYDTYLNVARFFVLSPELILAIGSQNGYGLGSETKSFHNFTFAKGTYEIDGWLKLSSGTYYVNNALSESYQNVGALVAVDFEYINDVLWTEIDWLSGQNTLSGVVMNTFLHLDSPLSFYAGLQVPASGSGNSYSGNFGVSYDLD